MALLRRLEGDERLHKFNTREGRVRSEESLRRWTNVALLVAVAIGVEIAVAHRGTVTASLAAFGAALGLGAVLGFLFGIPGAGPSRTSGPNAGPTQNLPVQAGANSGQQNGDASITSGSTTTGTVPLETPGVVPAQTQAGANGSPMQSEGASGPTQTGSTDKAAVTGASGVAPAQASPASADMNITSTASGTSPVQMPSQGEAGGTAQGTTVASSGPQSYSTVQVQPSNLEQVADWVTKLLLGGGLTQVQHIPGLVWQWARWVAIGMLTENDLAKMADTGTSKNQVEQIILAHQAFAAGLLDYGFILGFFGGFLITKLRLGRAISGN
jgi:hypothetical protein